MKETSEQFRSTTLGEMSPYPEQKENAFANKIPARLIKGYVKVTPENKDKILMTIREKELHIVGIVGSRGKLSPFPLRRRTAG